jgi:vesicular inhibitory amino acid transporter
MPSAPTSRTQALLNNDAAVVHVQDDEARPLRTGRATPLQTGLNMLNELEGQGLLGLSYTYVYSGWASVGCLLLCGGMAGFTGYALAMCMYDEHGVRVRDTYAAAGRACFGRAGARAVLVTQMTNLMCVCVVYLVLIGSTLDSVHKLVDDDDDAWQWLPHANQRIWTALATVAALPTVHVGGYKNVSWLSAAGTTIMVAIVIMGVAISAQHISEHGAAPMPALDITKVPAAFSMFIFAFSCHGIFPDLESSMAEPRHFQKVVGVVFSSNILVKAVFSLLGFFAFGTATMAVVTSNFATTPRTVISVLIAVNTWLSFPLPLVPVFNALTRAGVGGSRAARALQRSGIVLVCGAAALALPNFGVAMGLAGSLMLSFLTFIFPAVFFLRLHRPNLSAPTVACCYAVACVGALGCVSGLASNISILVNG